MNEDIGKPTTPRDRQVNNLSISGWLHSPVEKKQSERTRSWYLSTKVLLGADLPLLYVTLWINEHVAQEVIETALACLVAAGVSYVSIQMQSIIARANVAAISIDQAAAQMGINTIALIWERSALVLVLIFLSGWFREDEHEKTPQLEPAEASVNPEVLNVLVEKLETLSITVNQLTNPSMPALPAPTRDAENSLENEQPIYSAQFASKEQEIAAILAQRPDASAQEIAQEASCSVRTAEKWMQKARHEREKTT